MIWEPAHRAAEQQISSKRRAQSIWMHNERTAYIYMELNGHHRQPVFGFWILFHIICQMGCIRTMRERVHFGFAKYTLRNRCSFRFRAWLCEERHSTFRKVSSRRSFIHTTRSSSSLWYSRKLNSVNIEKSSKMWDNNQGLMNDLATACSAIASSIYLAHEKFPKNWNRLLFFFSRFILDLQRCLDRSK